MQCEDIFFDTDKILSRGQLTLELIRKAWLEMGKKRVNPNCDPGFLRQQLPDQAPEEASTFEEVCKDTEEKFLPGVLHWQSPKFFAYYPSCTSDISIYAEMVAQAFVCAGFSYAVSPSHTELENVMVDWSVTAMNLPEKFLIRNSGGGVMLGSATQAIFLSGHAAKAKKIADMGWDLNNPQVLKLVGYYSETTHISSSRALFLKDIHYRRAIPCYLDSTVGNYLVDLKKFRQIVEQDVKDGLVPFYYGASVGTTFSAAVDQIEEIGKICQEFGIWLNCDAAYLGSTWICEEFRSTQKGLDLVDSLVVNFSKPLFMGSGGSMFYVADKKTFVKAMGSQLEFSFYNNKYSQLCNTIDYKDWQVGLDRRNSSLRLFFLFKFYGLKTLRESIRSRDRLAQYLEKKVNESKYFQMFSKQIFGLVCFQLKIEENRSTLTKELSEKVKDTEEGYLTPSTFKGQSILRIVIGNSNTREEHLDAYWEKIVQITERFLAEKGLTLP